MFIARERLLILSVIRNFPWGAANGVNENEIERVARRMLVEHGRLAARTAVEQLNECIDQGDWNGRDTCQDRPSDP